jgi:toxin FitB
MYLADTNVISEVRNAKRRDKAVAEWFARQPIDDLHVSVITIRELYFGAFRLKQTNVLLERELIRWIEGTVIDQFGNRILSIDTKTARIHARLALPNSNMTGDSLIAATAIRHGLTVATRNTVDFVAFGVRTFNPWEFRA